MDDYLGRLALAGMRAAQIVDDDVGTAGGKEGCIGLTQATTGAGDDDGLIIEAEVRHDGRVWEEREEEEGEK